MDLWIRQFIRNNGQSSMSVGLKSLSYASLYTTINDYMRITIYTGIRIVLKWNTES
jgi:hypothetical protein